MSFGGKTRNNVRECKFKAVQWIKAHRKSWTNVDALVQVTKILALVGQMTAMEEAVMSFWTSTPKAVEGMHVVQRWISEGRLPDGQQMPHH
jgi:hypothetical protein